MIEVVVLGHRVVAWLEGVHYHVASIIVLAEVTAELVHFWVKRLGLALVVFNVEHLWLSDGFFLNDDDLLAPVRGSLVGSVGIEVVKLIVYI